MIHFLLPKCDDLSFITNIVYNVSIKCFRLEINIEQSEKIFIRFRKNHFLLSTQCVCVCFY